MPRRPDFRVSDESVEVMFPSMGVLSASGGIEFDDVIIGVYYDNSERGRGTYIISSNGSIRYFELEKSQVASAGEFANKLVFQSEDTVYLVRRFAPEDGAWISKYEIPVPIAVLQTKASIDALPVLQDQLRSKSQLPYIPFFETMVVYYGEKERIIEDVVYMTSAGTYSRDTGGWKSLDLSNDKYEDMLVAEVAENKAKEFLTAYDENAMLSIKEVLKYTSSQ